MTLIFPKDGCGKPGMIRDGWNPGTKYGGEEYGRTCARMSEKILEQMVFRKVLIPAMAVYRCLYIMGSEM